MIDTNLDRVRHRRTPGRAAFSVYYTASSHSVPGGTAPDGGPHTRPSIACDAGSYDDFSREAAPREQGSRLDEETLQGLACTA